MKNDKRKKEWRGKGGWRNDIERRLWYKGNWDSGNDR